MARRLISYEKERSNDKVVKQVQNTTILIISLKLKLNVEREFSSVVSFLFHVSRGGVPGSTLTWKRLESQVS